MLYQALKTSMMSKLVKEDVDLFKGVLMDLFPDLQWKMSQEGVFFEAIDTTVEKMKLDSSLDVKLKV